MPGWIPRVNGYSPGSKALLEIGADVFSVIEPVHLDPGVREAAWVVGTDDRGDVVVEILLDRLHLLVGGLLLSRGRLGLLGGTRRHNRKDRSATDPGRM